MTAILTDPDSPPRDLDAFRIRVEARLAEFLAEKAHAAHERHLPALAVENLRTFLHAGGKRLRPLLCACGWHAAGGGGPEPRAVTTVAAALEMFRLAADFARTYPHVAEQLGQSAAILVGGLALTWSDELLHAAGLPLVRLAAALRLIDDMRTEVMYGQYLDLIAGAGIDRPAAHCHQVQDAKYTVELPLRLGAMLAGGDERLLGNSADSLSRSPKCTSCATICSGPSATRASPASHDATTYVRASTPSWLPSRWPPGTLARTQLCARSSAIQRSPRPTPSKHGRSLPQPALPPGRST